MESENGLFAPGVTRDRKVVNQGPRGPGSNAIEPQTIAYFALDLPHKGQASYVHIHEIVDNLRRLGWGVDLFTPRPGSPERPRGLVAKTFEYMRAMWQVLTRLGRYDVLYVRAHALAWPVAIVAWLKGLVGVQ